MKEKNYLIWWLNQQDLELISVQDISLPVYIMDELGSMQGRPLRGRLWQHASLVEEEAQVDPWPPNALGDRIATTYGGLVIKTTDVPMVGHLPGFVTDQELKIV